MRRATSLLAIIAVWASVLVAPASANDHVSVDEAEFDFFYENAKDELVLVTGPPFDQGCIGEGFALTTRKSTLEDGLYTSRMIANGVELRLYSAPSFDVLVNAACEAFFTGGDMPEPIAFGIGTWKYEAWDQTELLGSSALPPSVGTHTVNSAWATMTFTNGSVAWVRGNQDFIQTENGPEILVNDVIVNRGG